MVKEKSKLARTLTKFIPNPISFLPIGLGVNTARYAKEERINSNPKITEHDLKKEYSFTGIATELLRDIPTISLISSGTPEAALTYYALVSYIADRI